MYCCWTRQARITLGNREATEFVPAPGVSEKELADAAQLSSLADETPEGRSVVVLAKKFGIRERQIHNMPGAQFVAFTAQTRMSGVDLDGVHYRKGATDAIRGFVSSPIPPAGGTDYRAKSPGRGHAARRGHARIRFMA